LEVVDINNDDRGNRVVNTDHPIRKQNIPRRIISMKMITEIKRNSNRATFDRVNNSVSEMHKIYLQMIMSRADRGIYEKLSYINGIDSDLYEILMRRIALVDDIAKNTELVGNVFYAIKQDAQKLNSSIKLNGGLKLDMLKRHFLNEICLLKGKGA
jgi:chorismate mutase